MGKTKNYRLSEDEKRIHREAVELRKKTDKQLIEYIEGERTSFQRMLGGFPTALEGVGYSRKRIFFKNLARFRGL